MQAIGGDGMMILALIVLIALQHIFWSITTHRLVNKLMSRNYFEYQQAQQAFTPKAPKLVEPEPEESFDPLDGVGGF